MMRNKKGSLFDGLELIPEIFLTIIIIFAAVLFFIKVNDYNIFPSGSTSDTLLDNFENNALGTLDLLPISLFIGMFIGSIVLAFALPSNPSLFWINILLLGTLVLLSVGLSNAYEELSNANGLSEVNAQMSITGFFMGKLPLISTIYGIVLVVVMLGIKSYANTEAGAEFG